MNQLLLQRPQKSLQSSKKCRLSPLRKKYVKIFSEKLRIPGAYNVQGFIKKDDIFLNNKKEKVNYELIKNLIFFLFKLHEKGIYLKDTKYNNFYYFKGDFKIFDLEGIKFYKKPLFKFERLKDLSTLAMVLEWQKVKNARELVFNLYKQFYPEINEKDFGEFNCLVNKKRKKREKKFATSCIKS